MMDTSRKMKSTDGEVLQQLHKPRTPLIMRHAFLLVIGVDWMEGLVEGAVRQC